jgi:hypothetical protein
MLEVNKMRQPIVTSQYIDTGCAVADHVLGTKSRCLECPLESCIEDRELYANMKAHRRHMMELINELRSKGYTIRHTAELVGLSKGQVERYLQRIRNGEPTGKPPV